MMKCLPVVLGRFKNELPQDLVGPVVRKPDGNLFQGIIPLLIPQAQVDVFGDVEGVRIIGNGNLVQG